MAGAGVRGREAGKDGFSPVGVAAIPDPMDSDGFFRLLKDHTVVANTETKQAFELSAERLDPPGASSSVAVNCRQNIQGDPLLDGADLFRDARLEANLLHYSPWCWRT